MTEKKPKQHFPTPEERDERHKIEDVTPEDALKILLGAVNDRELNDPDEGHDSQTR